MHFFKADLKYALAIELRSWLLTSVLLMALYVVIKLFHLLSDHYFTLGTIVVVVLKLSDRLFTYQIKEIQIDEQNKQFRFILKSLLSGQKIKSYELAEVKSAFISHSGLTKHFRAPLTLKLHLSSKETALVTNRYGFRYEVLSLVDQKLKSLQA